VVIGGNFIVEEHTVMNMHKNHWKSNLFARDAWESWMEKGAKDATEAAHGFVEEVTANYKKMEPVIDPSLAQTIDEIVKEAQKELA